MFTNVTSEGTHKERAPPSTFYKKITYFTIVGFSSPDEGQNTHTIASGHAKAYIKPTKVQKVRFKHLGSANTEAKFVYNHLNGRYWPCEEDVIHTPQGEQLGPVNTQFDNENWLKNNEEQGRLFE